MGSGLHGNRPSGGAGGWYPRSAASAANRGRAGETPSAIYRHYLDLPPWPLTWAARLAFHVEQPLALRGLLSRGTSLFAVARRPAADLAAPDPDEFAS